MSPLDDELRIALQRRASHIAPSPDPLPGIERRAARIRHRRAGAAVAASALAVTAIAFAVPALTRSPDPTSIGPAATAPASTVPTADASAGTGPTASASQSPGTDVFPAAAFSFDDPWVYRGDPAALADDFMGTVTRDWAALKGVGEDQVDVVPLYGEIYEPSARAQVVYAARVLAGEEMEYGLVLLGESGPEFRSRAPIDRTTTLLLVPTPGDEIPGLYAVAAPDSRRLEYAQDGRTYRDIGDRAPGVGSVGLDGDTSDDRVRLTSADGSLLVLPAPTFSDSISPGDPTPATLPDNLLAWPERGVRDAALVERAVQGYAASQASARAQVDAQVLLTAGNDAGQRYTVLQAWVGGQPAHVFAWIETPGSTAEPVLQPVTAADTRVVAILLTGVPGRSTDELVVIGQPNTGQVLYDATGTGEAQPVEPAPGLDGVVLLDRALGADADRLVLIDGNGNMDAPTFDGLVFTLLCGARGCG